jgi:hypothetical protein
MNIWSVYVGDVMTAFVDVAKVNANTPKRQHTTTLITKNILKT